MRDFYKEKCSDDAIEDSAAPTSDKLTEENSIEKVTKDPGAKYQREEAAGLDEAVAEARPERTGVQFEIEALFGFHSMVGPIMAHRC